MRSIFTTLIALLICTFFSAHAQTPEQQTLAKAAIVLLSFDHFAAACDASGGPSPTQRRTMQSWQTEHQVARVRAQLPQLDQSPGLRQQVNTAAQTLQRQVQDRGVAPCEAAVRLAGLPDAQFTRTAPALMVGATASASTPPNGAAAATKRSNGTAPAMVSTATRGAAINLAALLPQVDSFAFDSRAAIGAGGWVTQDIYPILLFKDGQALKDIESLMQASDAAAHQRAHPEDWTRWRRTGGEIQIQNNKGEWRKLPFGKTYSTLPAGLRLDGRFQRVGGAGNIAVGGSSSVAVWSEFTFSADGNVVKGGGTGASSAAGGTAVTTLSNQAALRGTYRIDGLSLRIKYENGEEEQRLIVLDAADPQRAIWLDGRGYVQRRR